MRKIDETTLNKGRWLPDEIKKFEEAVELYGRDYSKVMDFVGTRSYQAVRERFRTINYRKYKTDKGAHWTSKEKSRFKKALVKYGCNRKIIA